MNPHHISPSVFVVEYVRENALKEEDHELAGAVNIIGIFSTRVGADRYISRLRAKFPLLEYWITSWRLDDDFLPERGDQGLFDATEDWGRR